MSLHPKFIIESDNLIMMWVEYHRDIAMRRLKVKGGGWFRLDSTTNTYILSGKSTEFGAARFEDIRKCVLSGRVYTDTELTESIADKFKFAYYNGYVLIDILPDNF